MDEKVKIVVTAPEDAADAVREAMGQAGAGRVGEYSFCSFSIRGVRRFLPSDEANPSVGTKGQRERVIEERIEVTCSVDLVKQATRAICQAHPYEEPAIDIYPLLD